jgi:hypothetical protein
MDINLYKVCVAILVVNLVADYAVLYVERQTIDETQYRTISPQARGVLAEAKSGEILMLQIKINSPKELVKALPLSEENLAKIGQID